MDINGYKRIQKYTKQVNIKIEKQKAICYNNTRN